MDNKFQELTEHSGVELAQAAQGANEPVGQVTALQGNAFIVRADGTKIQASDGAPVYQGDTIETGANGAIGITFADQSSFSLADSGQMTIDEMVYDPSSQSGKSAVSVAEGLFTFVSGQIAKTDVEAMTISTPVATIGVRGTTGGGKAGAEGTPNTFTMFADTGLFVDTTVEATLGISAALTHAQSLTGAANGDIFYLVLSNDTDSALYRISETDNDGVFDTAELVTNLTGMNTADITAMDGTSFTDFA